MPKLAYKNMLAQSSSGRVSVKDSVVGQGAFRFEGWGSGRPDREGTKTGERMTKESKYLGRFVALSVILIASVFSPTITFANDLVFGPVTCQRGTGAPTVFKYSFTAPEPSRNFIFKVYNGGLEDTTYEQVSSSTITLNGSAILGPNNFNQNVTYVEVPVTLQAQNTLNVEVRGKPGGAIIIKVFPFLVIDTPVSGLISTATSVSVAGHLYSEATGIKVNGVSGTVSGTNFTVSGVSLVEGINVLTATVVGSGGFTGQASVTVTQDTIPPAITLISPQDGTTVSVPSIDIIGSVNEPSSVILVNGSVVALTGTAFTATGIPLQIGLNAISVEACDSLGNRSTIVLHVTYATPVPTATLTATPTQVQIGTPSTLQWTTTGATAISILPGIGAIAASGTQTISPPATTTYTLTAVGPGGTVTAVTTVTVTYPPPSVTLSAAPGTILEGTSAILSWTATNASTCSIEPRVGAMAVSGASTVSPTATTIYTIACSGAGGTATASTTVNITYLTPTATLSATPESLLQGVISTLSWESSNAQSCMMDNGIGPVPCSGSVAVTPPTTTTYTLSALGAGGIATASATVTVNYPLPTASLSASPSSISLGSPSMLSWSSSDAQSCSVDNGIGPVACEGSISVSPATTTTYTFTATGPGGTASKTATVAVSGGTPTVTLSASQTEIHAGGSSVLSWNSTNADSCEVWSPSGYSTVANTGTMTVTPNTTSTYYIFAFAQSGWAWSMVTITVTGGVPTVALSASPMEISPGSSTTLSWQSTNADSCSILGIGPVPTSGSLVVSPAQETTYTITAMSPIGTASASATVRIMAPTVTLRVTPSTVLKGGSVSLYWDSANATSCSIDSGVGTVALSGSTIVVPAATTTYTIAATGLGGTRTAIATVTVVSPPPTASLSASPARIEQGISSTLLWSSTDAETCVFDNGIGIVPCDGSTVVTPPITTTYTMSAEGPGGSAIAQVIVTVFEPRTTVNFVANPGRVGSGQRATLSWTSTNADTATISPDLGAVAPNGTQVVVPTQTSTYTIIATGPSGTASATVTVAVPPEVTVEAVPTTIRQGESTSLVWTSSGAAAVMINNSIGAADASGSVIVTPSSTTEYMVTASGPGGAEAASVVVTVLGEAEAPPLGSFGSRYRDQIPADATVVSYDTKRFSLITGNVRTAQDIGLQGVRVTIHNHPEYGTSLTDAKGRFSLPVDGGGVVVLSYARAGFLASHRTVKVPWNGFAIAETVTLIPVDVAATTLTFDGNPGTVVTHRSSVVSDNFGNRACTIVLKGDNSAASVLSDGNVVPLTSVTLRATEFKTEASMPAKLPALSAYTYCAELSVDGADHVRFSKPVSIYVDNFMNIPVGTAVPVGYYDREQARWLPEYNGVVVELLDMTGDGVVDALDATGDAWPDDLNWDGLTADEVVGLTDTSRYKPGATFWRVMADHFSPRDLNYPYALPDGSTDPTPDGEPVVDEQKPSDEPLCINSYVERRGRIFHEDVEIPGTSYTLHYASNRVPGYRTTISIPASGQTVPSSLKKIRVSMLLAGRTFEVVLPPLPSQKAEFVWDNMDYLGRAVTGSVIAEITNGFVYDADLRSPGPQAQAFALPGGAVIPGAPARIEVERRKNIDITVYSAAGLGTIAQGWTLSEHNQLVLPDPRTIYRGDGTTNNSLFSSIRTIRRVAGTSPSYCGGDGAPASATNFSQMSGLAVDAVGNLYIAEFDCNKVRKIDSAGIVRAVAGSGQAGYSGDDGPAVQASLGKPIRMAISPTGELYILQRAFSSSSPDSCYIRKIDANGIIHRVAGNGKSWPVEDEVPAIETALGTVNNIAFDKTGNLYLTSNDPSAIRMIDTNGVIHTITRKELWGEFTFPGYAGDGELASNARVNLPNAMVVDPEGNLYFSDTLNYRVRKIDAAGIITTFAGNGILGSSGDGGQATAASIYAGDLAFDKIGNLLIVGINRVRSVDRNGIIFTIAGTGLSTGPAGGGIPATASVVSGGAIAVDNNGDIFLAGFGNISKVSAPEFLGSVPLLSPGDFVSVDADSGLGYVFTSSGNHKHTFDVKTGIPLSSFEYAPDGWLTSIKDRFGSTTSIERDAGGKPIAIVSPYGHRILLDVDSSSLLRRIQYPDGSGYGFDYTDDGLMTDEYDPNGNHFVHDFGAQGRLSDVLDPEEGHWNFASSSDTRGETTSIVTSAEGDVITYVNRTDSTGASFSTVAGPDGGSEASMVSSDSLSISTQLSCGSTSTSTNTFDPIVGSGYVKSSTETFPSGLARTVSTSRSYQLLNSDQIPDVFASLTYINGRKWSRTQNTIAGTIVSASPVGRISTEVYNRYTLAVQSSAVSGLNPVMYEYNANGRLTRRAVGSRIETRNYDVSGNLDYVVTADGKTFDYSYDVMGRLSLVVRPDQSVVSYDYDNNGNMTVLTNGNQVAYGLGYTANDQPLTMSHPLSGTYQYQYDRDRRLGLVVAPSGEAITNTYVNGSLATTTTSEGVSTYEYLCGGRPESITRNGEGLSFTYNGRLVTGDVRTGTLSAIIGYMYNNNLAVSSMTYGGSSLAFGYDNDGLLTSVDGLTIGRNTQNGLPETVSGLGLARMRSFNGYGELDGAESTISGSQGYAWSVTARDNAGRITRRVEYIGGSPMVWEYSYNTVGQLLEVKNDGLAVESYTYDLNGNRLTELNTLMSVVPERSFSYTIEDHVLTAGTDSYQFDVDGFLQSRTTSKGTTYYQYSSRGELMRVDQPDGTILSYVHDPLGRRIAKQVNGVTVEKYLWQNQTTLLAVYDRSDNLLQRFVYADTRTPVSMTAGGQTFFLLTDQVGTLRVVADSTGLIVKRIDYDSFGNIISDSNPSFSVPFGFAGGLHDRDTGLVRFGYRDYSPELGRFVAKDPIDFAGGDTNLYAYVTNDPINFVDPLGLWLVGGVVGPISVEYNSNRPYEMKWGLATNLSLGGWIGFTVDHPTKACQEVPELPVNLNVGWGKFGQISTNNTSLDVKFGFAPSILPVDISWEKYVRP